MSRFSLRARRVSYQTDSSPPDPTGAMLIGGRHKSAQNRSKSELRTDFATMNNLIGPLTITRAFEQTLPSSWESVSAPGAVEFVSYKNSGSFANMTSYFNSLPANSRVIYYHEPEGPTDWPSGQDFVNAYVAEYDKAKSIRPEIPFGMCAGGFQYRNSNNGVDGSYIPPANKVDFYAMDTYRDNINSFGQIQPIENMPEFQTWYSFVKSSGKDLYITEYGRGLVGEDELPGTEQLRAQTMAIDYTYLKAEGFKGWIYWYGNYGPDGRSWAFTDQGSIDAWSAIAVAEN